MHQTRGMRTIGNIVWFVVAGIWQAFGYAFAGVLCCLTIVGIPFGMQAFKLAGYVMWPFGRTTVTNASGHALIETVFNVVWLFTVGWGLFVGAMVSAFVVSLGAPGDDAAAVDRKARWLVRVLTSLLLFPGHDADDERAMIEEFLVPIVAPV